MTTNLLMKKQIEKFGNDFLLPLGFELASPFAFERRLEGLSQGFGFVKGVGGLAGKFTANVYWRYTVSPSPLDGVMDYCQRIGVLNSGRDEWFQIEDAQSWRTFGDMFKSLVDPVFSKYKSIGSIVDDFEKGVLAPELAFGVDAGWRAFNLGYCYLWLGNKPVALRFLREVLDQHSFQPFDWVQNRKKTVLDSLSNLEADQTGKV